MSHPKQVRSKASDESQPTHPRPDNQFSSEGLTSEQTQRQTAVNAVKNFLAENASGARHIRHCKTCGDTMHYLDAYFWLDGTNVASLVPLPFCPSCDPDVLTSLRRKRASASPLDLAS